VNRIDKKTSKTNIQRPLTQADLHRKYSILSFASGTSNVPQMQHSSIKTSNAGVVVCVAMTGMLDITGSESDEDKYNGEDVPLRQK
jgi:hypothetical protein